MFILYSVVLGIIIGYISGGSLKCLAKHPFKSVWLAVLAFSIQLLIFSDLPFIKLSSTLIVIFHLLSYVCLISFIFRNRSTSGIVITGLGIFLNALVIFINGGYMPTLSQHIKNTSMSSRAEVISQGAAVNNSMEATSKTLLPWLGDIFYLPSWIPFSNVFSIGDIIIAVGVLVYLILNMMPEKSSNPS